MIYNHANTIHLYLAYTESYSRLNLANTLHITKDCWLCNNDNDNNNNNNNNIFISYMLHVFVNSTL